MAENDMASVGLSKSDNSICINTLSVEQLLSSTSATDQ